MKAFIGRLMCPLGVLHQLGPPGTASGVFGFPPRALCCTILRFEVTSCYRIALLLLADSPEDYAGTACWALKGLAGAGTDAGQVACNGSGCSGRMLARQEKVTVPINAQEFLSLSPQFFSSLPSFVCALLLSLSLSQTLPHCLSPHFSLGGPV